MKKGFLMSIANLIEEGSSASYREALQSASVPGADMKDIGNAIVTHVYRLTGQNIVGERSASMQVITSIFLKRMTLSLAVKVLLRCDNRIRSHEKHRVKDYTLGRGIPGDIFERAIELANKKDEFLILIFVLERMSAENGGQTRRMKIAKQALNKLASIDDFRAVFERLYP